MHLNKKTDLKEINKTAVTESQEDSLARENQQKTFSDAIKAKLSELRVLCDPEICDVCMDESSTDGNLIVICEVCNVAVHQECYGSELLTAIPDGPWLCQRCAECLRTLTDPSKIRCKYCPNIFGAMKKIDDYWVHCSCVDLIPDAYFDETCPKKERIIKPINSNGYKKHMCYCCHSDSGRTVRCDYPGCRLHFHATCAVRHKLLMSPGQRESLFAILQQENYFPVYCHEHSIEVLDDPVRVKQLTDDHQTAKQLKREKKMEKRHKEKAVEPPKEFVQDPYIPHSQRKPTPVQKACSLTLEELEGNSESEESLPTKDPSPPPVINRSLTIKTGGKSVQSTDLITFIKKYEMNHKNEVIDITIDFLNIPKVMPL